MKAAHFRNLHHGPGILVIGNAWDAGSARIFERAGFNAIGTTSAGVAASLGRRDGERITRAEMLDAVRKSASAVSIPVTADMEAGFGNSVDEVVETVRGVIEAGAVGMNLEDSMKDVPNALANISFQVEKIRATKKFAPDFVLNARTDVYLAAIGEPETRFEHAVRRAAAYREAGADCLFLPGVRDAETIRSLVRAIPGPVNILATAGSPPIPELEKLGVARVSVGSGPMRATLGLLQRIARELLEHGTYTSLAEGSIPYDEVNRIFADRS